MATSRIQKLLFSEYSDLEDLVLVESPFAETNRQGKGIRQVQIGLTPTKLILASYHVEALDDFSASDLPRPVQDPDIESFELVSAYPVECVNLSVFRHRRRQTLKARFSNGKVLYYEIGGWHERKMLWSAWCERIKFLSPYESGTSKSETSVASSSSSSSLYIARSSLSVSQTGQPILWCHYASSETNLQGSWTDPHLYLGPQFFEKGVNYMTLPEIGNKSRCSLMRTETTIRQQQKRVLKLSAQHEMMAKEAVDLWESQRGLMHKVRRRYGFHPFPQLLGGIGLWHLFKSQAFSLQAKRSASEVHLPLASDVTGCQLTVQRAQLVRTVSLETLAVPAICPDKLFQLQDNKPKQCLQFWTPDDGARCEWRRRQYRAQQRHLRLLRKLSYTCLSPYKSRKRRNIRTRSKLTQKGSIRSFSGEGGTENHQGGGDSCMIFASSGPGQQPPDGRVTDKPIKRFQSSGLAHQLTMIDKQLFLQVNSLELGKLRKDMGSWRAPQLRALMCFSHRLSCLVATHIVNGSCIKDRAVLIVKYVGVAYKCHKLHNLQSAESVLQGLHSPAVYRLHTTWRYVRKHHACKYRRFEDLSRRYQDPRLPLYQQTLDHHTRTPPYLPSVSLLAAVLLGKLSHLPRVQSSKFTSECSQSCVSRPSLPPDPLPTSVRRFLSTLHIYPPTQTDLTPPSTCLSDTHLHTVSRETLLENLDKFFAPVSESCPERRHLQDVEYFLESSQEAATRYAIPLNPRVRDFLLLSRYEDMSKLFSVSRQVEP